MGSKAININVPDTIVDLTPYRVEINPNETYLPDDEAANGKLNSMHRIFLGFYLFPGFSVLKVDENGLQQLQTMGFSETQCRKALLATNNSGVEVAMEWLLAHIDDPGKMILQCIINITF